MYSGEEGWAGLLGGVFGCSGIFPGEGDVVEAGEAGFVDDGAVEDAAEVGAQVADTDTGCVQRGADDGGAAAAVVAGFDGLGLVGWWGRRVFDEMWAWAGSDQFVDGEGAALGVGLDTEAVGEELQVDGAALGAGHVLEVVGVVGEDFGADVEAVGLGPFGQIEDERGAEAVGVGEEVPDGGVADGDGVDGHADAEAGVGGVAGLYGGDEFVCGWSALC